MLNVTSDILTWREQSFMSAFVQDQGIIRPKKIPMRRGKLSITDLPGFSFRLRVLDFYNADTADQKAEWHSQHDGAQSLHPVR